MPATGESQGCKQVPLHACMLFVDLKEVFDRVPRDVIWWTMRKLGIDVWLVRLVQSIFTDVSSRIRICTGYSEEFLWALPATLHHFCRCTIQVPRPVSMGAAVRR